MAFKILLAAAFAILWTPDIFVRPAHAGNAFVLAQAGSVGGTIGKNGKSASGQTDPPPQTSAVPRERKRTAARESAKSSSSGSCASLTSHRWSSWAAGLFGAGDTAFRAGGVAIHNSGITGQWSCKAGKIRLQWPGEPSPRDMTFSEDGKTLLGENDQVRFSLKE